MSPEPPPPSPRWLEFLGWFILTSLVLNAVLWRQ